MKIKEFIGLFLCLSLYGEALLVVNEPNISVYETPEEKGHIEDVLPYSTKVEITEEKEAWVHVICPGWQGWVLRSKLLEVTEDPALQANAWVGSHGAYIFGCAATEWGPFLHLPFESPLKVVKELPEQDLRWLMIELQDGQTGYVQRNQVVFSRPLLSMKEMIDFSQQFLGLKYLWGGTSSFGYDCSGFVRMLYRQMGIELPRNANQQAVDPQFKDICIEEAQAGDLVFFQNKSGKVVHVGMMINETEFIHASGRQSWICISSLADERFRNGYYAYSTTIRRNQGNVK